MRSPLALRTFSLVAATVAAALGVIPALASAQAPGQTAVQAPGAPTARPSATVAVRPSSARPASAAAAPKEGQCAYHPRNQRLLGHVVGVGPMNVDAGRRPAVGQRRVQVELANGVDIGVTYPRNLHVRDCR